MATVFGWLVWAAFLPVYVGLWRQVHVTRPIQVRAQISLCLTQVISRIVRYAGWCLIAASSTEFDPLLFGSRFPAAILAVLLILQYLTSEQSVPEMILTGVVTALTLIGAAVILRRLPHMPWLELTFRWIVTAAFFFLYIGLIRGIISRKRNNVSIWFVLADLFAYAMNLGLGLSKADSHMAAIYAVCCVLQVIWIYRIKR